MGVSKFVWNEFSSAIFGKSTEALRFLHQTPPNPNIHFNHKELSIDHVTGRGVSLFENGPKLVTTGHVKVHRVSEKWPPKMGLNFAYDFHYQTQCTFIWSLFKLAYETTKVFARKVSTNWIQIRRAKGGIIWVWVGEKHFWLMTLSRHPDFYGEIFKFDHYVAYLWTWLQKLTTWEAPKEN